MTMYTFYIDAEQKKFEESLKFPSKEEIISIEKTIQSEIDKWKDEPYWYIDPADILIVVDTNVKPYNMYMTSSSSPPIKITFSEPKPKTRFEMIIEKK